MDIEIPRWGGGSWTSNLRRFLLRRSLVMFLGSRESRAHAWDARKGPKWKNQFLMPWDHFDFAVKNPWIVDDFHWIFPLFFKHEVKDIFRLRALPTLKSHFFISVFFVRKGGDTWKKKSASSSLWLREKSQNSKRRETRKRNAQTRTFTTLLLMFSKVFHVQFSECVMM